MSEEWVGEARGDPVVIVEPDPGWPRAFERLRSRLARALGPRAVRIDHVGSTAVPGLSAKPVIDIQVSVPDVDDEDSYRRAIESLGWELTGREPHHRFFRPPADRPRTVHVHVCGSGSDWERDHLLFVGYLRAHPERAAEYSHLKKELAARYTADRTRYTDAKDAFVRETLQRAREWKAGTMRSSC